MDLDLYVTDSSSSSIFTTYSQQMRIETLLKKDREQEAVEESLELKYRQNWFQNLEIKIQHHDYKGLEFTCFNHNSINFYFKPYQINNKLTRKTKYRCKFKYNTKYKYWELVRNVVPIPCKTKISAEFTDKTITDSDILNTITAIYKLLEQYVNWNLKRMKDKYEKYLKDELDWIDLDPQTRKLFFTQEENRLWREKRNAILRRMINDDLSDVDISDTSSSDESEE